MTSQVPDVRHRCECGHLAGEHPMDQIGSDRSVDRIRRCTRCPCANYVRRPSPKCQACNHPAQLHGTVASAATLHCWSTGCLCPRFVTEGETDPRGFAYVASLRVGGITAVLRVVRVFRKKAC